MGVKGICIACAVASALLAAAAALKALLSPGSSVLWLPCAALACAVAVGFAFRARASQGRTGPRAAAAPLLASAATALAAILLAASCLQGAPAFL